MREQGVWSRTFSRVGFLKMGGTGLAGALLGVACAEAHEGAVGNTSSGSSPSAGTGPGRNSSLDLPHDAPLVAIKRGRLIENVYHGRVAACGPGGEVLETAGDSKGYAYLRSAAKPFQALPLLFSGAAKELGLTNKEIAVVCASHTAEEAHIVAIRSVLQKAGLSEDDLQTPRARPPEYAHEEEPSPVYHECSGNHAGILALSVYKGWDTESYRDPEHPAQRLILQTISRVCGVPLDEVLVGGDNCGVPAFAMPLENLAVGYARLATGRYLPSEALSDAAQRIWAAMREYPLIVAGSGMRDTNLMRETGLVCKTGADAIFAAGSLGEGWGLALKFSDGEGGEYFGLAIRAALARQGVEGIAEPKPRPLYDLHGKDIGTIEPLV